MSRGRGSVVVESKVTEVELAMFVYLVGVVMVAEV